MSVILDDLDFIADAIEALRLYRQLSPEQKAKFMEILRAEADRCAEARARSLPSPQTGEKPDTRH